MRDAKIGMLSRWKKASRLDFQEYNHFKYLVEDLCMRTYASSRVKRKSFYRKSELHMFLFFGGHIGAPKFVHQYGVSIQSSTKVQETFRQITQKL